MPNTPHDHAEKLTDMEIRITRIDERTQHMTADVIDIKQAMERHYVTRDEFRPVRQIVYGAVGVCLVSLLGALVTLVVRS